MGAQGRSAGAFLTTSQVKLGPTCYWTLAYVNTLLHVPFLTELYLFLQRKLFARSDRVKSVDFHPTEPWLLAGLYNGSVNIYNHDTGALIKTFEVAEVPVRCVRFIPRKNWFVAGSDDFQLRAFNYNTHEKVAAFEAHPDYIRCLTVHPTASVVLTGSDDMTIKAWDWDKQWKCIQVCRARSSTPGTSNPLARSMKDTRTIS
jgi:WD40 repeat protein